MAAIIRVGPAGWSYKDWKEIVYPVEKPKGFHEATYLAQYFDTIEINSTFYRPREPGIARNWVRLVSANPRFRFTAKLWRGGGVFSQEHEVEVDGRFIGDVDGIPGRVVLCSHALVTCQRNERVGIEMR